MSVLVLVAVVVMVMVLVLCCYLCGASGGCMFNKVSILWFQLVSIALFKLTCPERGPVFFDLGGHFDLR